MTNGWRGGEIPPVTRMKTGVPGLDAVLGGGLPAGRTCLIAGAPGTGKTTLGNQLAFAHAAAGGLVVFATLLAEAHDVMLQNIRDFTFFDRSLPGDRVRYLNLLSDLEEGGLDRVAATIRREIRESGTNLLVVDGIGVIDDVAVSSLDVRHFAQQLDALAGLLGCTTVLLSDPGPGEARRLGAQLNGMVLLSNEREGARNVRLLEVAKLRGAGHVGGTHEFAINESGVTIYPRLESLTGQRRAEVMITDGLGTGVATLDTMLGGGLKPLSSTMLLGTPGAGKTLLGLTFLAEGARNGERGLMASFHEPPQDIVSTADRIGLDLARHIDAGVVRVLWNPPIELSVDAWAWQLLEMATRHRPQRVFIDALTDVQQFLPDSRCASAFVAALTNELRSLGATALLSMELDAYSDDNLIPPVPFVSATLDNGILLRHVELHSMMRRLISVLKVRQAPSDPAIREFTIDEQGIEIHQPFTVTTGLLTGQATTAGSAEPGPDR